MESMYILSVFIGKIIQKRPDIGHRGTQAREERTNPVTTDKHTLMNREKGSKYTPVSQIKYMYLFT